ncbi:MAG TPA: DUF5682 family protein [Roseiflexaceae bacterium]|nr:DUF5682 family protein [Roseiflexaceae bacterium]
MTPNPQLPPPNPQIFGIRHHGPGSARSLRAALEALRPDAILVEGPPDAAEVLPLLAHPAMRPPIALLIYAPDAPRHAVYYPFAIFSPEWQALHFGLSNDIPVRFMDLPQAYQLGVGEQELGVGADLPKQDADHAEHPPPPNPQLPTPRQDPLGWLAAAAGYSDGERWWEHMVEQRRNGVDLFAAILEAMAALRAESPPDPDPVEAQREAWMRQTIRAAQAEGYERIAVVCGAWHAPALVDLSGPKADTAVLIGLPKITVQATWVPWTHGRLAYQSGYGAGIESPGWYEHLWLTGAAGYGQTEVAVRWLARVARLLREQDLDASSAHVIEAVRLAEALAALRDRPLPGLPELNEASQAVLCFGSELPMRLIHQQLIVGEALGAVPDDTPLAPLQQDLAREQRRLRMPAEASWRDYDLDLRKPNDRDRSHLLHRLGLLGVPWGALQRSGGGKSTFHEIWRLQWQPELSIALIEAGAWGNTIADAATAFARDAADKASDLPALTKLIDQALLADLTDAIEHLMLRLRAEAALASDIAHLMDALPPLAGALRYGNVRKTDAAAVAEVVDGLATRICVGLPTACAALNDDSAQAIFPRLLAVDGAIALLQNAEQRAAWHATLGRIAGMHGAHGLLAGRACRILLDGGVFSSEEATRRIGLALSTAGAPSDAAAWIEGLLKDSGALLVHDDALWRIVDGWLISLRDDAFTQTLPLLRRTFATFAAPERRMLGERAARPQAIDRGPQANSAEFDEDRGAAVLVLVERLLGLRAED